MKQTKTVHTILDSSIEFTVFKKDKATDMSVTLRPGYSYRIPAEQVLVGGDFEFERGMISMEISSKEDEYKLIHKDIKNEEGRCSRSH